MSFYLSLICSVCLEKISTELFERKKILKDNSSLQTTDGCKNSDFAPLLFIPKAEYKIKNIF